MMPCPCRAPRIMIRHRGLPHRGEHLSACLQRILDDLFGDRDRWSCWSSWPHCTERDVKVAIGVHAQMEIAGWTTTVVPASSMIAGPLRVIPRCNVAIIDGRFVAAVERAGSTLRVPLIATDAGVHQRAHTRSSLPTSGWPQRGEYRPSRPAPSRWCIRAHRSRGNVSTSAPLFPSAVRRPALQSWFPGSVAELAVAAEAHLVVGDAPRRGTAPGPRQPAPPSNNAEIVATAPLSPPAASRK